MSSSDPSKLRALKILLHVGFFISGVSTVLIGQLLPILSRRFSLNDEQTGWFFPSQFVGSIFGTLLTNWLGKKNRFLTASFSGCFLMGIGVATTNADSIPLSLFGFFLNGIGIGLTLPSINMLILEFSRERAASALSILNVFWGIGAILSQPFVDHLTTGTNVMLPTLLVSGSLLAIGAVLMLFPRSIEPKAVLGDDAEGADVPIWSTVLAWLIAAFNFIHVGFESAIGGWLKTYSLRVDENSSSVFLPPITAYFLFFVLGRIAAPILFRFLDESKMLMLGLLTVLGGMLVLLNVGNVYGLIAGAAISGFGTSWIFPTNMSRFNKTFGPSASRRATPFFLCGTIGSIFSTWFIGWLSHRFDNDLRSGMFLLLGSIIVLIVIQTALMLKSRTA